MKRIEELKALEHLKRRILKLTNGDATQAGNLCQSLLDEFDAMPRNAAPLTDAEVLREIEVR